MQECMNGPCMSGFKIKRFGRRESYFNGEANSCTTCEQIGTVRRRKLNSTMTCAARPKRPGKKSKGL